MSAPTPTTDFVKGLDLTVTIDGVEVRATTVEYADEIGEVDMTSLKSGGNYEFTTDIRSRMLRGTLVVSAYEGVTIPENDGTAYPGTLVTAGGRSHDGTVRFLTQSEKGGAKGGYTIDFTAKFTGEVTDS
jgi:hypothetical protein